ncbi:hypothetical protein AB9F39_38995, partial [Rhizobium leguminosarum]|uniref:hypothetical protein n=1 Tax=Rhizobium leguminosarum TaxID=384 RepID=UPI003F97FE72
VFLTRGVGRDEAFTVDHWIERYAEAQELFGQGSGERCVVSGSRRPRDFTESLSRKLAKIELQAVMIDTAVA